MSNFIPYYYGRKAYNWLIKKRNNSGWYKSYRSRYDRIQNKLNHPTSFAKYWRDNKPGLKNFSSIGYGPLYTVGKYLSRLYNSNSGSGRRAYYGNVYTGIKKRKRSVYRNRNLYKSNVRANKELKVWELNQGYSSSVAPIIAATVPFEIPAEDVQQNRVTLLAFGPSHYCLTCIPSVVSGTTINRRSGNSITAKRLNVQYSLLNTTVTLSGIVVRVVIYIDKYHDYNDYSVTDLFSQQTWPAVINSPYTFNQNRGRFKILYDQKHVVEKSGSPETDKEQNYSVSCSLNNLQIDYAGDAATDQDKNNIFIIFTADTRTATTNVVQARFTCRLVYIG